MNISVNKNVFITKFLTPIAKITDRCIITITPKSLYSIVALSCGSVILYNEVKTSVEMDSESITLNIPDVNRLIKMIKCIDSDSNIIQLIINSNNIEFKSKKLSFKYYMLENGVINNTNIISVSKINNLSFDLSFNLPVESINNIVKGITLSPDITRIYLYTKDNAIYADLSDRTIENSDMVSYKITEDFDGDELITPSILGTELFKLFNGLNIESNVKINKKQNYMLFTFTDDEYTLKYIVSSKRK